MIGDFEPSLIAIKKGDRSFFTYTCTFWEECN
jgi:hypothetical protein